MNFPIPYPQIRETPPGAHITFPEVDWVPAQPEALDMRPGIDLSKAEPLATPVPPSGADSENASLEDADKVSPGTLAFVGVAVVCFIMVLVQAGVVG